MNGPPLWAAALHLARVLDDDDPDGRSRLRVQVVGLDLEVWAPCLIPGGCVGYGAVLMPRPGETVAVAFAGADPDNPVVIGALWSGPRARPEAAGAVGDGYALVTGGGAKMSVTDSPRVQATIAAPGGTRVTVTGDPDGTVTIERGSDRVRLEPSGIRVSCAGTVEVNAASVTVNAAAVTMNTAMATVSGVVKCDTVLTNTVIATSYTTGVGNIW